MADPDVVDEAWRVWRDEIAFADQYVTATDLDVRGGRPDDKGGQRSLRWVLLHMIEEYARHLGNSDLLRAHRRPHRHVAPDDLVCSAVPARD